MARKILSLISLLAAILLIAGCNLPTGIATTPPQQAFTFAAQTVQAELTRVSLTQFASPQVIATTPYVIPTTAIPPTAYHSPTPSPIPCNLVDFIDDITIDDGTDMSPGQSFTKTWRLRNAGTCTWTTSYQLAFKSDEAMGGPISQPLTGNVAPGQMIDVSVNLVAPSAPGSYVGRWGIKDGPSGNFIPLDVGGNSFWVKIDVVSSGASVTLSVVDAESGSVRSNGEVKTDKDVGDLATNVGSQVFVAFDINAIPDNAIITEVKVNFTNFITSGDPFADLHCLRVYHHDYAPLDAGDFFIGVPVSALIQWCDTTSLSTIVADADFKTVLQGEVTGGDTRFRLRLQFSDMITNSESNEDLLKFGVMRLLVTYTLP